MRTHGVEQPGLLHRAVGGPDGGQQPVAGGGVPYDDGAALDAGDLPDEVLDLGGVDQIAPDLGLPVQPAEEDELPVGTPSAEVAGAVRTGSPVRDEALCGLRGPAEIPGADAAPPDVEVAGLAFGDGEPGAVEQIEGRLAQRCADRDRGLVLRQFPGRRGEEAGRPDRRLGGAVVVEEPVDTLVVQQGGAQGPGRASPPRISVPGR